MEKLLTIGEAATRCGVTARQVYKLIARDRFGPEIVRLNRSVRVRESELDAWFRESCPDRARWANQWNSMLKAGEGT